MEASKNPFSLSLQASIQEDKDEGSSRRGVEEDPELENMIEQEPDYQEDSEQMKIIEEKAKAWTKSQRMTTPRGAPAVQTAFPPEVVSEIQKKPN